MLVVRPAAERAEWSIPGSRHLDAYVALKASDADALAEIDLPAEGLVVTVRGAGKVSQTAMQQLRARGYDARSLAGGMRAWSLAWNIAQVPVSATSATVIQVRRTGKGCLSYLIAEGNEAAVIDAALDPAVYMDLADSHGWTITQVLDTHVHADHLSRSRALATLTGATLSLPAQQRIRYPFHPLHDGDMVRIGASTLRVRRTPGHSPESMSYLLDGSAILTGDTLFLDGVGRPDLETSAGAARERARLLFQSLRELSSLPSDTVVLPGHTSEPVPFDGRPLAAPLGEVHDRVLTLRLPEAEFVATILARIPPTPPNHARIVSLNEAGEPPASDPMELEAGANRCAIS